jgi:hypothetical protein
MSYCGVVMVMQHLFIFAWGKITKLFKMDKL